MNTNHNRVPLGNPSTLSPTPRDLTRFIERHRAQRLGFELPLTTREAAEYVGLHPKTIERMARSGQIPAHPVSGRRRKTWKYYPTELDTWIRSNLQNPQESASE